VNQTQRQSLDLEKKRKIFEVNFFKYVTSKGVYKLIMVVMILFSSYRGASVYYRGASVNYRGASVGTSKKSYRGASVWTLKIPYRGASVRNSKNPYRGASVRNSEIPYRGASFSLEKKNLLYI
jgi:hypothetical protein